MTTYRVPKQRFRAENWMAVWFVEIAQWRRFCDRLDIALCYDILYTTEDAYMDWYMEVSRRRIGRPKPVPESDYASRELFDKYEVFQLIEASIDLVWQLDARLPASFVPDFRQLAAKFVERYTRFMRTVKGPGFTPPVFEHLDRADLSGTGLAGVAEQDIIPVTQPSQHIPDEPASSSRPEKMALVSLRKGKWKMNKPLSFAKQDTIATDWGWKDSVVKLDGGGGCVKNALYELKPVNLLTLAPGAWIDDRIIYAYMLLLRDREEVVASVFERKPTYFFMDPFFIPLAKTKNWKNPESYVKLHNFYCDYGSAEVGPTINNVDFIFLPTCVTDNHCILSVFSVMTWGVVILDPLYDNASYPEEE
uniref:Ubiquitin-like protease family profile domain-containing protein n=1 Tax=Daucus carota subsp. sativus TaxID=79200 RepID=A0A162A2F6_DAUCS